MTDRKLLAVFLCTGLGLGCACSALVGSIAHKFDPALVHGSLADWLYTLSIIVSCPMLIFHLWAFYWSTRELFGGKWHYPEVTMRLKVDGARFVEKENE